MTNITITHKENGSKGQYIAQVEGFDEPAELTYSRASDQLIIVDHTGVPDSLRGQRPKKTAPPGDTSGSNFQY